MSKLPEHMTLAELLHQKTASHSPGNPMLDRINTAIQVRLAEQQDEASNKLVTSTDKLVAATQRLGTVTWWLVAGTFLLGLSAGVDVALKLMGRTH
jgi:hypothetical protein